MSTPLGNLAGRAPVVEVVVERAIVVVVAGRPADVVDKHPAVIASTNIMQIVVSRRRMALP
jgi:hypothetical protein